MWANVVLWQSRQYIYWFSFFWGVGETFLGRSTHRLHLLASMLDYVWLYNSRGWHVRLAQSVPQSKSVTIGLMHVSHFWKWQLRNFTLLGVGAYLEDRVWTSGELFLAGASLKGSHPNVNGAASHFVPCQLESCASCGQSQKLFYQMQATHAVSKPHSTRSSATLAQCTTELTTSQDHMPFRPQTDSPRQDSHLFSSGTVRSFGCLPFNDAPAKNRSPLFCTPSSKYAPTHNRVKLHNRYFQKWEACIKPMHALSSVL